MNSVDQSRPVFLSYRRNDQPGYVARLSDDINRAFGDVVFRDVDSIVGGDEWQIVLKRQIAQSQVVLAIIGKQWLAELSSRDPEETDYVRLELNTARALNIDVIPVLLDNVRLPDDTALGDLAWLHELQTHSLTDTQGRWPFDSDKLVDIIGKTAQLKKLSNEDNESNTASPLKDKWWIGAIALSLLIAIIVIVFALNGGDRHVKVKNGVGAGGDINIGGDVSIGGDPEVKAPESTQ